MQNIHNTTLILKVNPKNGSVTLPKKFRQQYNIFDSLTLKITQDNAFIKPVKLTLADILSRPIDPSKFISEKEIERGLEVGRSNIKL